MNKNKRMRASGRELSEALDERKRSGDEGMSYDAETFRREAEELAERYPEACGKPLPDEVIRAVMDGMSLTEAYEEYLASLSPGDEGAERGKNTATRAPVRGVSGGAAVRERGEDDFLRGFNADEN